MFKSRKRIRLLGLVTAFLMLLTMILPCGASSNITGNRDCNALSFTIESMHESTHAIC